MQGFLTSVSALAKDVSAAATQAAAQAKTQAQKTQEEFRRVVNSASSAEAGETASGEGEDTAQAQGSEVGQAASGGKGLETETSTSQTNTPVCVPEQSAHTRCVCVAACVD